MLLKSFAQFITEAKRNPPGEKSKKFIGPRQCDHTYKKVNTPIRSALSTVASIGMGTYKKWKCVKCGKTNSGLHY